MALPTVHIRKGAFFVLAWAAIETFKKECIGFIFGYPPTVKNNFYYITDAVPFQRVKRRSNLKVELSVRVESRFKKFNLIINSVYPKYLGDFHSHPEWGDMQGSIKMSPEDLEGFNKTPEPLEFVISISSRKRGYAAWEALKDGSVKGSIGKFNLHIGVYTVIYEGVYGGKLPPPPQQLKIVAPKPIEALNRLMAKKYNPR